MAAYSFLNIAATFNGPDGSYPLGSGSGAAEEGISIEMLEDKDDMKVGADGTVMHSLRASNAARISVRLLKTSPVNAQLQDSYNIQKGSNGTLWGQNIIKVSDIQRGDLVTITQAAFVRQPSLVYAKDGNINEWQFLGTIPAQLLGVGVPSVNT